jgi:hypothetical protein
MNMAPNHFVRKFVLMLIDFCFPFRWDDIRPKLEGNAAYEALSEFERVRIFKEFQRDLEEAW